jgi:hypothetical protein
MPERFERCVRKVSKKIKPRKKGETRMEAARRVCHKAVKKKQG